VENVRVDARGLRQTGKAYVGDEVAAEASWLCLMGDRES